MKTEDKKYHSLFELNRGVELISIKNETVYLKLMTFQEALNILKNKKQGRKYLIYQKGFSQFNNVIKL